MALPLANNFEGGSDGTTITTGNSGGGSGNAFDTVDTSITFDDDQTSARADGTLAADFGTPASVVRRVEWDASFTTATTIYGRLYMYRAATPSEQQRILRFHDGSGTEVGRISWHTDAKIYSFDSTLAVPAASSFTLTAGQLLRFEFKIVCNASTGIMEVKAFVGHSTSEIGTYTRTNVNTLTNVGRVAFGNTIASAPGQFWVDALQINDTGYPGPVSLTQTVLPDADVAAGGWATSPLFSKINDSSDATVISATAS